jgi:signal transduction histidine kinase
MPALASAVRVALSRSVPRWLALLAVVLSFVLNSAIAGEVGVRIGILAKRGTEVTLKRWGPTADYLNRQIPGHRFEVVPLDFNQIFPAVREKRVDFILSNSAFYVVLENEYRAFRIATLKTQALHAVYTRFGGVIFTLRGRDDIDTLADLRGKRFMGVEPGSLGGYMAALREFRAEGIDPEEDFAALRFGGTHDAVVYAVRDGKVDGGTVRTDTLERMAEEGLIDLQQFKLLRAPAAPPAGEFPFLNSTRLYPEWPMAALPQVPQALVQQVAVALLQMPPDCVAAQAAKCAGWAVPANYQPVHELLRELHLRPYQHLDRIALVEWLEKHPEVLVLAGMVVLLLLAYTTHVSRLNVRLGASESKLRGSLEQLERARNQLIQSEKMAAIGQLAAGVAHEINNPIGYVNSNLSMLENYASSMGRYCDAIGDAKPQLPEAERERLGELEQEIDLAYLRQDLDSLIAESREGIARVRKIVADLKDFARQDRGEWEEADVNVLLDSALNIVHNELKYKTEVVRQFGQLPPIRCVGGQLEQVFVNLLVNAGQAIPERGTITVRSGTDEGGSHVWIEVEDTGIGIPEQNLAQLFDPFFTTKPVGKGTGLGLSISYGIVQHHGGDIQVESEAGHGCLFRVVLPVAGPEPDKEGVAGDSNPPGGTV